MIATVPLAFLGFLVVLTLLAVAHREQSRAGKRKQTR